MKSHQSIDRRKFFALSSSVLPLAANRNARAARGGLRESFSLTVCPWSAENPRHDHAQIFPLKSGNLMLVWSEYYVRRPFEHLPYAVLEDRHGRPGSVPHLRARFTRPRTQLEWPHHVAGEHRLG